MAQATSLSTVCEFCAWGPKHKYTTGSLTEVRQYSTSAQEGQLLIQSASLFMIVGCTACLSWPQSSRVMQTPRVLQTRKRASRSSINASKELVARAQVQPNTQSRHTLMHRGTFIYLALSTCIQGLLQSPVPEEPL